MRKIRSRAEKEARIIDLHENMDYTIPEICAEEHVSATTAVNVIKKNDKSKELAVPSARSQALELFKLKTPLVDVAIKLDLSADQTQSYYTEFQRLNGLDEYVMTYFKTEGGINYFLGFYKECEELKITPATAMEAIAMSRSITSLVRQRDTAAKELADIQSVKTGDIVKIDKLQGVIKQLTSKIELLKSDKRILENCISDLFRAEEAYRNSEFYQKVTEIANEILTRMLGIKNFERVEARIGISKVIRQNPDLLPVICSTSEVFYNKDLDKRFNELVDKSLEEGHHELLMMAVPCVVAKLSKWIDELYKTNKKEEIIPIEEKPKSETVNDTPRV